MASNSSTVMKIKNIIKFMGNIEVKAKLIEMNAPQKYGGGSGKWQKLIFADGAEDESKISITLFDDACDKAKDLVMNKNYIISGINAQGGNERYKIVNGNGMELRTTRNFQIREDATPTKFTRNKRSLIAEIEGISGDKVCLEVDSEQLSLTPIKRKATDESDSDDSNDAGNKKTKK